MVAAAQGIRRGWPLPKILERIQQAGEQTEIFFTLDTLHYLQKGGRIGRVQAMAGALLNLKPVITVDKGPGTYITAAKGRSLAKSVALIADLVAEKMKQTPAWVARAVHHLVGHGAAVGRFDLREVARSAHHLRTDRAGAGCAYRAGLCGRGVRAGGFAG